MILLILSASLYFNFSNMECTESKSKIVEIGMCDSYLQCRVKLDNGKSKYVRAPFKGEELTSSDCKW